MIPACIALGSNLQDPLKQLRRAVIALDRLHNSQLTRLSSVYRSAPVGPAGQPDYLNAAVQLNTRLPALDLLDALQQIEQEQGRVRSEKWGPRTLDLDLLLYGNQIINSPRLTVPHPRMLERDFVLYPLHEISDTSTLLPDGSKLDNRLPPMSDDSLCRTDYTLGTIQHPQGGE